MVLLLLTLKQRRELKSIFSFLLIKSNGMFKKVLIAEDHESSGISVLKTLIDLEITDTHFVYYCDDAMERVKRSVLDHTPFDLLITDLSFDEDHRPQTIKDGAQLVSEVR